MESDGPAPDVSDTACPAPDKLRDFLDERITLNQEDLAHISRCHDCTRLLDRLSARDELVSAQSLAAALSSAPEAEPELEQLIRQVQVALQDAVTDDTVPSPDAPSTARDPDRNDQPKTRTHGLVADAPGKFSAQQLEHVLPSDRFHVQRLVSRGGTAAVYLAYDQRLQRNAAIKVLARERVVDRRRFEREAQVLASLDHPHIVGVYDFGELHGSADDLPAAAFLVMEYLPGGSLVDVLQQQRLPGYVELAELLAGAALGVHAAHRQGLVHRDLKPANILLDAELRTAKVGDFGLARRTDVDRSMLTHDGDVVGTPAYMSPEQVEQGDAVGVASDVYGLGATLYTALTGEPPFRGSVGALLRQVQEAEPIAPRIIDPQIPADLETICLKAMEKSPRDRYASAEALASDLTCFAEGRPIAARPVSSVGKLVRLLKRNPLLGLASVSTAVLAAVLVVGSIAAAIVFAHQRQELRVEAARAEAARRQAEQALAKSIDAADQLLLSATQDTELLPRTPDSQDVSQQLLERAREYFEALLKEHRGNPRLTFELARAHVGLAQIAQRLGDADRVQREVTEALKWMERIPPDQAVPARVDALRGEALLVLGNAQVDAGDAKQAVSTLIDAVAACRRRNHEPPPVIRERLWSVEGLALRALAEAETTVGKHDAARGHLAEARKRFQELVAHYPDDESHVRDAALVDMSLATMAIDRGDVEDGKQYLLSAAASLNQVGNKLGHSLRVRELLGIIQINLGLAERRLGHVAESEQAYRRAIDEFRRLAELEPGVHSHKWKLVTASLNIGGPLLDQGREQKVVTLWQDVVPVLDQLIEAQPESQRYVQVKAMLQSNIAMVLRDMGQAEQAIEPLVNATRILREQSRRVDDAPEAYLPVALNYSELATTYLMLERWMESLQALDQSDEICRDLLESHPDFEPARGQLLDNMFARFKVLHSQSPEDGTALLALSEQAVELARELVNRQPEMVEYQVELPLALVMRGQARLAQSDLKSAYADGQAAVAHLINRFNPPWAGRPQQAYKDALLLLAKIVSRERIESTDEATREAKSRELQEVLARAREMGAKEEEIQAIQLD